jgi:hypothetical protein
LIVLDLDTQEVPGFRRGFAYTGVGSRGSNWEFTPVCPKYGYQGGRDKDVNFSFWFVGKVLLYPGQDVEFKKLRGEIPWN